MKKAIFSLILLSFAFPAMVAAQKKVHATIVDDRLGVIYGQIRYWLGCLNGDIRFWEYGSSGPYHIDVKTISQIEVEGVGLFRRFSYIDTDLADSGQFFLRQTYRGSPFMLYELYYESNFFYYYYDETANRLHELAYTAVPTTFGKEVKDLIPACQKQLEALAQREQVKIPPFLLEDLSYNENDLRTLLRVLNKDTVISDPSPSRDTPQVNCWYVGVLGRYSKANFTKGVKDDFLGNKMLYGPAIGIVGLREWKVSNTRLRYRTGVALSYSWFYLDWHFVGNERVKLLLRQYAIRPLIGIQGTPWGAAKYGVDLGFTVLYNFAFYQKTLAIGGHVSREHLVRDKSSMQPEFNLGLRLAKHWRVEVICGFNITSRQEDDNSLGSKGYGSYSNLGLYYRWE